MDPNTIGKHGNKLDETTAGSKVSPSKAAPESTAERATQSSDTVRLTNRAQLLERLEKSLETLPAVDSQRVSEVKSAIENGNYEIDSDAIADAMILFERTMGE